jgi:chorismate synthase
MATPDDVTLRRLATHAEYQACVALQELTWGHDFRERVPTSLLHVAHEIGGVVAGAFDPAGALVGFVFGLTGVRDGRLVHWSDMLAVRPDFRDRGLGLRLKRFQLELVRPLGVEAVLWTFDPLLAKNAHLNLVRLGARVVAYVEDMYGSDSGSTLHGNIDTDRLIVAWDVAPNDVGPAPPADAAGPADRIEIPDDFYALLERDRAEALHWRLAIRSAFRERLATGWRVAGFERGGGGARPCYLLVAPAPSPAAPSPASPSP